MEPVPVAADGHAAPRAYLRLGGATLARHQLAVALAAGCERIACVARALDGELIELQHATERAGARFHMISGSRALSGLVTANDELLVFADGLVPNPADALDLLGQAPSVLVLSAETAVPRGFERIDLNSASAGLMLLPGGLVERLNELPPDAEPISALLRIALQAGVTQRRVPQSITDRGHWLLVRNEDEAHLAEQDWMERHTEGSGRTPGRTIAAFAVRHFGPALLHAGSGSRVLAMAAMVFVLLALGAGWFELYAVALGLCAPAWLLHQAANIIDNIQCDTLGKRPSLLASDVPFIWLLDSVIALLLVLSAPYFFEEPLWQRAFAPFVLFGLLKLLPRSVPGKWTGLLEDRMLLAVLLSGLAFAGALGPGLPALVALMLLGGVILGRYSGAQSKSNGITRA